MINLISFKSDNINFNPKRTTAPMPQDMTMPDDEFIMQNEALRKAAKKEKQQENLQKMSAYGTVAIGVGLVGSLLLTIFSMIKHKGKSQTEEEIGKLTKATINWTDFKDKKDVVASLNSKTTSKVLRDAFNNIINGEKLSAKAKKWGGSNHNNTNMIYLYGHGGVGKTYVAEQYAQECGALFTSIKYPDMGSPFKDAASMKVSNTFDQIVDIDDIVAVLVDILQHDAVHALLAQLHEKDIEGAAHRGHLDLHLVILGQHDLHVTVDQHAPRLSHDHLATQEFAHEFLGVIVIAGDVVDDVPLDALQIPLPLSLDDFKFAALLNL